MNNRVPVTNAKTYLEYEEHPGRARVWLVVEFDGETYKSLHISGPKEDVKAYYEGRLTFKEIRSLWSMPQDNRDERLRVVGKKTLS